SIHGCFCLSFLFSIQIINHGTILGADVIALTVQSGWIMRRKKHLKELGIADLVFVEINQNNFSMAGFTAAYGLIIWLRGMTAGIATQDLLNALNLEKYRVGTPKASTTKKCLLHG